MNHPLKETVEQLLAERGGLYTFDDIVALVRAGQMQSFSLNDSWAVTQVCEFPQKKALNIVFMVGDLDDLEILEADLIGFAREHGCDLGFADGRMGFMRKAFPGWNMVSATFVKDFTDGA
jgi:hypothetical protein